MLAILFFRPLFQEFFFTLRPNSSFCYFFHFKNSILFATPTTEKKTVFFCFILDFIKAVTEHLVGNMSLVSSVPRPLQPTCAKLKVVLVAQVRAASLWLRITALILTNSPCPVTVLGTSMGTFLSHFLPKDYSYSVFLLPEVSLS